MPVADFSILHVLNFSACKIFIWWNVFSFIFLGTWSYCFKIKQTRMYWLIPEQIFSNIFLQVLSTVCHGNLLVVIQTWLIYWPYRHNPSVSLVCVVRNLLAYSILRLGSLPLPQWSRWPDDPCPAFALCPSSFFGPVMHSGAHHPSQLTHSVQTHIQHSAYWLRHRVKL